MNWTVLVVLTIFAIAWFLSRSISQKDRALITSVAGVVFSGLCIMLIVFSAGGCATSQAADLMSPEKADSASTVSEAVALEPQADVSLGAATIVSRGTLKVHFIDVGQGESEFIELPNGKTLLIDAGPTIAGSVVVGYIKSLGYASIDYVVITHAHDDHRGGMQAICETFDVGEIWAPEILIADTDYEEFFNWLRSKGIAINAAASHEEILSFSGCAVEVLSPDLITSCDDLDDCSVVLELTHGDDTFLFTGDASVAVLKAVCNGHVDVIKLGQHGSSASTDAALISQITPSYAVISCGVFNASGYPNSEVLSALSAVSILRTDLQKTLTATSDEKGLSFDKISITSSNAPLCASTAVTLICIS